MKITYRAYYYRAGAECLCTATYTVSEEELDALLIAHFNSNSNMRAKEVTIEGVEL